MLLKASVKEKIQDNILEKDENLYCKGILEMVMLIKHSSSYILKGMGNSLLGGLIAVAIFASVANGAETQAIRLSCNGQFVNLKTSQRIGGWNPIYTIDLSVKRIRDDRTGEWALADSFSENIIEWHTSLIVENISRVDGGINITFKNNPDFPFFGICEKTTTQNKF